MGFGSCSSARSTSSCSPGAPPEKTAAWSPRARDCSQSRTLSSPGRSPRKQGCSIAPSQQAATPVSAAPGPSPEGRMRAAAAARVLLRASVKAASGMTLVLVRKRAHSAGGRFRDAGFRLGRHDGANRLGAAQELGAVTAQVADDGALEKGGAAAELQAHVGLLVAADLAG